MSISEKQLNANRENAKKARASPPKKAKASLLATPAVIT